MRQFGFPVCALAAAALYQEAQTAERETVKDQACEPAVPGETPDVALRERLEKEAEMRRLLWENW